MYSFTTLEVLVCAVYSINNRVSFPTSL